MVVGQSGISATRVAGRQIANLQVLRGIAALLVVTFHVQPLLNAFYGRSLHSHFGVVGVDIFFVLSGFVMFYAHPAPQPAAIPRFLALRCLRIVPLYWLATLVIVAVYLVGFRPVGLHHLGPPIVLQSLLFVPTSFPDGRHDLILTVGWTLMFELFFYAAFAATFALRSLEKSFLILGAVFVALSGMGQVVHRLPFLFDFYTSPIMLEFLYGAALALLYLRWSRPAPGWLAAVGSGLMVAGLAVVVWQDFAGVPIPHKHAARFVLLGLPAFLVVAGALAMERGGWVLGRRWLLALGGASYALYLFHPLLLHIAVKGSARIMPHHPLVAAMLSVSLCIMLAIALHRWVEQPLLALGQRLIARREPYFTRVRSRSPRAPAE